MVNKPLAKIEQDIKAKLSEYRFKHTQSVKDTALKIFKVLEDSLTVDDQKQVINKEDFSNKLSLAALLHDSCKELGNEEQLELAQFYKIKIYEVDQDCPNLLHARIARYWVEEEYEILDPYVLKAIEEHTLGGINMFLSSKIIFLADMIEPLRQETEDLKKLRSMIYDEKLLDQGLLFAMDRKINYVIEKRQKIHPLAIEARNSLL